ncbi:MAG: permease-like cell division protein FtsX [Chromatiaceae bacterium]|jgi:cell division transport system permease protein
MGKQPIATQRGTRRLRRPLVAWVTHHLRSLLVSLGQLLRSPLATSMTVAVIGIALALPEGLYVLTRNVKAVSSGWEQTAAVSLFLRPAVTVPQAEKLAGQLRARSDIAHVRLITPDQALKDLRDYSGFAQAVDQLPKNPLPVVLALRPAAGMVSSSGLETLRRQLAGLPEADLVRVDSAWISRFEAIVGLVQRGVLLLAGLLALAVLLVVGNTIRLEIQNRRNEIQVMELVGATSSFIRRPFLYIGAWYGLLGALVAWVLVTVAVALLQGPVSTLAALYRTAFPLSGVGPLELLGMLGSGVLLGLLGSWMSVGRHLATAEPR